MERIDLTVTRMISASPEEIFDVWIDPKSPGSPWFGAERVILAPAVDGLFYHAVRHEGRVWAHYGRFLRLERPHLIEHTWVSEATRGLESVVTVTFHLRSGRTEVVLRHAGVPDDRLGRQHEAGWGWVLSTLAERFKRDG